MTSTPVEPPEAEALAALVSGTILSLAVVAGGDDAGRPHANAMATMQRTPQAEHEELWGQLFVDDVFVDVVRVVRVNREGTDEVTFLARFRLPDDHLDGRPHRARVRFVSAVSRIVARRAPRTVETTTAAEVEADFSAALQRPRARVRRA